MLTICQKSDFYLHDKCGSLYKQIYVCLEKVCKKMKKTILEDTKNQKYIQSLYITETVKI